MRFIVVSQDAASVAHIEKQLRPQSVVSAINHATTLSDLLTQLSPNPTDEIVLLDADHLALLPQVVVEALPADGPNPPVIALLTKQSAFSAEALLHHGIADVIFDEDLADVSLTVTRAEVHLSLRQTLASERARMAERVADSTAELRQLNQQLAKAMHAKDEFLANMSHELRTPLTAILGKSEVLQDGVHGPLTEKQRSSIQMIEESGQHLLSLINDILDLAKIEAGKVNLDLSNVSIAMVAESALRFVQQLAHERDVAIEYQIDPRATTIQADARRLKQILVNLLSNAIKFTPAGGRMGLTIASVPEEATIEFQVWDMGIGIDSAEFNKLFVPFTQLDGGIDREQPGTGLGLSLVYKLTELHNGRVAVTSQPNAGSCFTVVLPSTQESISAEVLPPTSPPATEPEASTISAEVRQQPLILIVEDNPENTAIIEDYLNYTGFHTHVATSGAEAIELAAAKPPSLILMDVQMPGMDGIETTGKLRQFPGLIHVPVIALTALAMPGDRERCLAAGMSDYLSKPVRLKELVTLINHHLSGAATAQ